MTKITVTWQSDQVHQKPYNEIIDILLKEASVRRSVAIESSRGSPDTPSIYYFDNLTRVSVVVALADCVEQLSLLKCLINEPATPSCNRLFKYRTPEQRFTLESEENERLREQEYEKIFCNDMQKLQKDICFLCTTLKEGCKEIAEAGLFSKIPQVLLDLQEQNEDDAHVEDEERTYEGELKELEYQLEHEKNEYEKSILQAEDFAWQLRETFEDILAYGKQELRYTNDWENTRRYQHQSILHGKEGKLSSTIETYSTKIDHESRIHGEIENYILENTDDLQNAIQYWMQEYDDEIERRDSEILDLKMKWEQQTEEFRVLKETYEEHKAAIVEWLEYKEEKRKQEELELLRNRAATKIQAWWRGTMVRKKFGPYRKKKKQKDKKRKKGEGKGKGKKKK